ncbi:dihydroorotate dehydrogenase [Levilactobacillus acidifarinae]|uniref:Dihydroorotate dehydrogenase n=1 Tax=Levilactobacillus acidifarinae DSM 19394 = JCM 15949 TaxID=1423715 RepID=A0A0R1LTL2_9LACO|nr:dihydroorotate dehydrogenase [Levilactobacillus acidifarinae]KRK95522.1 dihydroorotate dehydrogenase 1B [Levilactobacillus acidifarinae DSM 19394]GEO70233.1 dihydroorotate dehydrogenase A (fumarate) [Levilactobacillus acidifarinae]
MERLSVNLAGVTLKNPVMPASGTAAYGQELAQQLDLNELGGLVIKSTTAQPKAGNPRPTTAETTAGWLNAIGLKNPGVANVVQEKLPWLAARYPDLPIVGSVAGASFAEYVSVARQLDAVPNVKLLEINISCPNVDHGGLAFGTDPHTVETLTREITAAVTKPVFMKLTPNVTDIVPIALAAEAGGASGLTMINTLTGMGIDLTTRKPILAHGTGGLSGKAIHPLAVRMIHQVRQHTKLPIIGVGGVFTPEDVLEFYLAGANAVEVGAATYGRPTACADIVRELPAAMDRYGIDCLQTLIAQVQG